jgi:hypothetical protein
MLPGALPQRAIVRNGERWVASMTKTLENLERQCIGAK